MNQVRTVLFIQALNSFVSGVLVVALPLTMKENVDVVMMGFVFGSMPLIMQFGRVFFAVVSDFWGRKPFFVSNGLFGTLSCLIYYFAHTPLEFLFGKVMEGTKLGMLWAVNRPFLLEEHDGYWKVLVYLRTAVYIASAIGSLLAGVLVVWFLYEGTMMLCALIGVLVIFLSMMLVGGRKEQFSVKKALRFLDFRKKERIFKIFLILFFVMGLSFGFRGGFVIPLFLDKLGFAAEIIGLIVGAQISLAGAFSYLFSKSHNMRRMILLSGVFYSVMFSLLGSSGPIFAGPLLAVVGVAEGMTAIGQEGVLSRITNKSSYGTDIGLLMIGLHVGEALSLALSGFLVSLWGFVAPFFMTAATYAIFSAASYLLLKD